MTIDPVTELVSRLKQCMLTLATAESCTGGMLGKCITDVPGASAVYPGGVISYSDQVKQVLLGVDAQMLRSFGAVSKPVAIQMAELVRARFGTALGVSVTGLAGPQSDGSGKPVGLVYIAAASSETTLCREYHFAGSRDEVRKQSVSAAAELLLQLLPLTEA